MQVEKDFLGIIGKANQLDFICSNSTRNSYVTWTIHRKFPLSICNWVMSNFTWKTVMVNGRFKHHYWPPKYNSGKFMLHRLILRSSIRRYVTWYHNWARLLLMGNFSSQALKIVSAALSTCRLFCIILILLPPSGVIPLTGLVVLNAREVLLLNIILNSCEIPPWSLFI